MINVLWTWILLLQVLGPILCQDNKTVKRAVFDIIPKYEHQDLGNKQETRRARKTVPRNFYLEEYSVNTKKNIEGKILEQKKYLNHIKFKFDKWNERVKQVSLQKGGGYKAKDEILYILIIINIFI